VEKAVSFFSFEPMKVPKNQENSPKLMNKIFVKNKKTRQALLNLMEYFWFWHTMCKY